MTKTVIIGSGYIARKAHIPAWQKMGDQVEIAAICDIDLRRAQALAKSVGVSNVYDNVGTMLSEVEPDIVDVCTPAHSHVGPVIASLMGSAHVLVEKPLALTVKDCRRIIDVESISGRKVGVVHSELYYSPVQEALRRVAKGDIGEVTGMRIFRSTPIDMMISDPDHWVTRLPGGAIGETGPHVVYMAQAFVGPIIEVAVRGRKMLSQYPWSPFEDYRLELMGEFATASAIVTFTNEHSAAHIDVWGTRGILRIELQSRVLVNYKRQGQSPSAIGVSAMREAIGITSSVAGTAARLISGSHDSPHDLFVRQFHDAVNNGMPPPVTAADGLANVEVMEEIARQLELQASVAGPSAGGGPMAGDDL